MARHPKQSQYDARSRFRRDRDAQADLLGWTKLDVLSAYVTTGGEIVLFDGQRNRYATTAEADLMPVIAAPETIVSPADVPTEEFGPRWNKARQKIGATLADLDLSERDHAWSLSAFEQVAANALRAVELLREHTGPDWREAIGIGDDDA